MVLFKNTPSRNSVISVRNDKKNVAKNIVNAFIRYMRENHSEQDAAANRVLNLVEHLIRTLKYNNQLVTTIIDHSAHRGYFKQFLATSARGWVE